MTSKEHAKHNEEACDFISKYEASCVQYILQVVIRSVHEGEIF